MNFLELVRDLYKESGESFSGGATATTADGTAVSYDALVAGWINEAWLRIQREHFNWRWKWVEFDLTLNTADRDYSLPTPTAARSAVQHIDWSSGLTLARSGETAYSEVRHLLHKKFPRRYKNNPTGKPQFCDILPNGKLRLDRVPDEAYILSGEGYLAPWAMTANADEPDMPDRFHKLIVWEALMDHARWEASPEQLQIGMLERDNLWRQLREDQLPTRSVVWRPLA
ncbi:MAG: hypothetical protein H7842_02580 [Gammaproteobacteria bacterium SHHR-1]